MPIFMHLLLVAPLMGPATGFERLAPHGCLSLVQVKAGVRWASTVEEQAAVENPEQTALLRSNVDSLWEQQEEALRQQHSEEQAAREHRLAAEEELTKEQQAARSLMLQEEEAHRNRVRVEQDEQFYQAAVTRLSDQEQHAKQLIVEATQKLEKAQAEARDAEQEIKTLKQNFTENEDAIASLAAQSANLHKLEDFAHDQGNKAEHEKLKEVASAQAWRMKEEEARTAAEEAKASIAKHTLDADNLLAVLHEQEKLRKEAEDALESDSKASAEWEQNLTALHSEHEAIVSHLEAYDGQAKKELQSEKEARNNSEQALIMLKEQEKQIDKLSKLSRDVHERLRKTRNQVEVQQDIVHKAHETEQQGHQKRVDLDRQVAMVAKSEVEWKEALAKAQEGFEVATKKMKETQEEVNHWQEEERSAHEDREAVERQHEAELKAALQAYSKKEDSKKKKSNSTAAPKAHKVAKAQTTNKTKRTATTKRSSVEKSKVTKTQSVATKSVVHDETALTAEKGPSSKSVEECSEHCSEVFGSCFWHQARNTQNSSQAFSSCLKVREGTPCVSGCQLTHEMSTVAERFSRELVRLSPPASPEQAPPCTATCSEHFANDFWATFLSIGNATTVFDQCMTKLNEGHLAMLASGCRPGCAITEDMAALAEVSTGTADDEQEERYCSPSCNEEFGKCVWSQVRSGLAPELGHQSCMGNLDKGKNTPLHQHGCERDCLPTSFMSALARVNINAPSDDTAQCSTSCSFEFSRCVWDRVFMGDAQAHAFARCQRELDAGAGLMADQGCEPGCALTPHMMTFAAEKEGSAEAKHEEVKKKSDTSKSTAAPKIKEKSMGGTISLKREAKSWERKKKYDTSKRIAAPKTEHKLIGGEASVKSEATYEKLDSVQQQSPMKQCLDVQPPKGWVQNTCEKQHAHTTKCQERRTGALKDGYCAKTCGLCKSTPTRSTAGKQANNEKVFLKRTLLAHEGRTLKACDKGCTMTLEDCKAACLRTVGCRSFTYSTKRKCLLKEKQVEAAEPSHKHAKKKPTWATYYLPKSRT